MRESEEAKALEVQKDMDSYNRRLLLKKIGVEWAEAYVHAVRVDGVTVQVNMKIGGKLPAKDYFRIKHIKCVARIFEVAEQQRDMNCTEYTQMSSSASTISDITQPQIGQIEV